MFPTSRRWADIADDSSDEFSDSEFLRTALPTVLDDSYQSKPDSALEDSKNGLNAAMDALPTILTSQPGTKVQDSSSPTDFLFLLKAQNPGSQGSEEEISKTNTRRHKKRDTNAHAVQNKKRRTMPNKRGRPEKKPCSVLDDASSRLNQSALKDDGLDTASMSTLAPYEMPEVTEELWQHRQESRMKDIELVMAKFCGGVPEEQLHSASLAGPDPCDRTISKRKWGNAVSLWHLELKLRSQAGDHGMKSDIREGEEKTPSNEKKQPKA